MSSPDWIVAAVVGLGGEICFCEVTVDFPGSRHSRRVFQLFFFFLSRGCSVLLVPFLGGSASVRDTILVERGVELPWFVRGKPFLGVEGPVKKRV